MHHRTPNAIVNVQMKINILSVIILFSGCSSSPVHSPAKLPTPQNGPQMVSIRSNIEEFWSQAENQPLEKWEELFEVAVIQPHQSAYDSLVFRGDYKLNRYPSMRSNFLKKFQKNYPTLINTFKHFEESIPTQINNFKKTFPKAQLNSLVYLMVSLRFDGKTGAIQNIPAIAFGMEYYLSEKTNTDILFSHELIHLYQMELFSSNFSTTLLEQAWEEGIATYASGILNPKIKDESLIFGDEKLAEHCKKHSNKLLKLIYPIKDSKDKNLSTIWFSGQQTQPEIPTRAGYCVGYRLAQYLGKTHSLKTMVEWPPEVSNKKALLALQKLSRNEK